MSIDINVIATLESAAKKATQLLGGRENNWVGVAAQFVQEKGWTWWTQPAEPFNVGNNKVFKEVTVEVMENDQIVKKTEEQLVFGEFASLDEGIEGYVHALTVDPAGYYTKVVQAIRQGNALDFLKALSESKYCAPPYPLAELENIYRQIVDALPKPEPAPPKRTHFLAVVGWFDNANQAEQAVQIIKREHGWNAWTKEDTN